MLLSLLITIFSGMQQMSVATCFSSLLPVYLGEWVGLRLLLLAQTSHQHSLAYANTASGCPQGHRYRLSRKS